MTRPLAAGAPMPTLSDCLKLPILQTARLVAGRAGLDRAVRHVHVVDIPDISPWIGPGVLVLTTGYGRTQSGATWTDFVDELSKAGAVGGIVAMGRYVSGFPANAVARADGLGFPLLELPWDVPFLQVSAAIHQFILEESTAELQRPEALQVAVAEEALRARSMDDLLTRLGG